MTADQVRKAFVVRVAPNKLTLLEECLQKGEIVIGWPEAHGLIEQQDWIAFRDIVDQAYYADRPSRHKAGAAAGHLWRFIHDMGEGDLVVVPALAGRFYVGEVCGRPRQVGLEEVGYARNVSWLNDGHPIQRSMAAARLQSRMKVYGSTAGASDLVSAITAVVDEARQVRRGAAAPSFETDLRSQLINATWREMREGKVDNFKFEHIVRKVLLSLGASEAVITARRLDMGDDIVAEFGAVGDMMKIKVCVQVKHYNELDRELGRDVVDEVLAGKKKVEADLGIVVTAGSVSEDAIAYAARLVDEGEQVRILDGEQIAELYLDHCVVAPAK